MNSTFITLIYFFFLIVATLAPSSAAKKLRKDMKGEDMSNEMSAGVGKWSSCVEELKPKLPELIGKFIGKDGFELQKLMTTALTMLNEAPACKQLMSSMGFSGANIAKMMGGMSNKPAKV